MEAATAIVREGSGQPLTVRGVAARAGVGMGTLRHHFPTQQSLRDETLSFIYEQTMPDDRIHDDAVPGRRRLFENLQRMLPGPGAGEEARVLMEETFRHFISPADAGELRETYAAFELQALRRIEGWLSVLVAQGSLAPGDNAARAQFLLIVVNGLALQRALPAEGSPLQREMQSLDMALNALPFTV